MVNRHLEIPEGSSSTHVSDNWPPDDGAAPSPPSPLPSEWERGASAPSSRVGAWEWTLPSDRIVRTPACATLIASTPDEVPELIFDDLFGFLSHVHTEDRPKVQDALRAAIWGGRDYRVEYRVIQEDGSARWLCDQGDLFRDETGDAVRLVGTTAAIGETPVDSAVIGQTSLTETALGVDDSFRKLRRSVYESSHRIKNHLQVLAAMADLAVMDGGESIPADVVKRLAAQIQALASVHDILTERARSDAHTADSPDVPGFHTRTLLERVLGVLRDNLAGRIHLSAQIDDTALDVEQATAVALLVNELVSNAAKHGAAKVGVQFGLSQVWPEETERRSARRACLDVRDDGPGFPEGFDPARHASTGIEIVESLALWDLGGTLSFTNTPEGGASVRVEFPLKGAAVHSR